MEEYLTQPRIETRSSITIRLRSKQLNNIYVQVLFCYSSDKLFGLSITVTLINT